MRVANDVLLFVLELCALVALFVGGLALSGPLVVRVVVGLAAVVGAAALWGMYVAPRRRTDRGEVVRGIVEAVVYLLAGSGLVLAGHRWLAYAFVLVALVNSITVRLWPSSLSVPAAPADRPGR